MGSVDDKLSKLRRKRELLEIHKRGLIQKIFSQELRFKKDDGSAFPDWEKQNLNEIAEVKMGLVTTMTENYVEDGVPLIRNSDITTNKVIEDKLIKLSLQFAHEHNHRKLKKGDIVTVHTGNVGVSAVIKDSLNGAQGFATLNTTIKDIEKISPDYLCWYFNTHKFLVASQLGDPGMM